MEVPADIPPEFEFGDMASDVCRREERGARKREEKAQKQREEARREESTYPAEEGSAEKLARTNRSDRKMYTEAGGEAATSQLHSRQKKRHMTNINLTDSNDKLIMDFVKDHEELYDMSNERQDKIRKQYLWKRFTESFKLSVKV